MAGPGFVTAFGLEQLGIDACAANASEVHMVALGEVGLEFGGDQFNLRVEGVHFGQSCIPESLKIGGFGVGAFVG